MLLIFISLILLASTNQVYGKWQLFSQSLYALLTYITDKSPKCKSLQGKGAPKTDFFILFR